MSETAPPSRWFGLRCLLRMCPCRHYEDAGGCGGQCINCGKIVGYVTRAELRAWADGEAIIRGEGLSAAGSYDHRITGGKSPTRN